MGEHSEMKLSAATSEVLAIMATFYLIFDVMSRIFTRRDFLESNKISKHIGLDIACKSVSAIFATGATVGGLLLMTGQDMTTQRTPYLEHILLACIGYFLYDTIAMYKVYAGQDPEGDCNSTTCQRVYKFSVNNPLLLAHHLILALVLTPMMFHTLDHEPGDLMIACALIFEASTPFVSLRAILSHLNMKKSSVYILNGIFMVMVFFCCRILVYPWFYYNYGRLRGLNFVESLLETPNLCKFFMSATLAPQIYWFRLMARGAVKVMEARKEKTV